MRTVVGILVFVVACGFPKPADVDGDGGQTSDGAKDADIDAPPDAPPGQCDLFAQTGCTASQKCTWIRDSDAPPTGHIGCVANGNVVNKNACTFSAAPVGFDNCVRGSYCFNGRCSTLCNPTISTSCGSAAQCGNVQEPPNAGMCLPFCSPLDDNTFKIAGTKTGVVCSAAEGCYGAPSNDPTNRTKFFCASDLHITNRVVHRSVCDTTNGCGGGGGPFLNGCSQGYIPLMRDTSFVTTVVCVAFCKPANCYQGNCANGVNAPGLAPHACNTTNAEGTLDPASATNNGDHCMYSWEFEIDGNGALVRSPTSDTVGFCFNHKKYKYDSNGNGQIEPTDADIPLCASATLADAIQFGCVDSTTAGLPFTGKSRVKLDLRLPAAWKPPAF